MRKLSKPWPPKNVSPDGQVPRSFSDAKKAYLAALPTATKQTTFARNEFDRLDKSKLRAVMCDEQGCLCAYCEQQVEKNSVSPIDHWEPLKVNPFLALDWNNLYLSCPTPYTCDVNKKGTALGVNSPVQFNYDRHLGFTSGGEMYVRKDTGLSITIRTALKAALTNPPDTPPIAPAILNLNHPALVAARRAALHSEQTRIQQAFSGRTATPQERQQQATAMLQQRQLKSFISIRVCWLRNNLGKGK